MPELVLNTKTDDRDLIKTLQADALFAPYPSEGRLYTTERNYVIGDRIEMYQKGADGFLYDLYLEE